MRFGLARGLAFRARDGLVWKLDRITPAKILIFQTDAGSVVSLEFKEFLRRYISYEWQVEASSVAPAMAHPITVLRRDFGSYSNREQAIARYRFELVKKALELDGPTNRDLTSLVASHPNPETQEVVTGRTLRRWMARYRRAGDIAALVDRRCPKKLPANSPLHQFFEDAVESEVRIKERPQRSEVVTTLHQRIDTYNAAAQLPEYRVHKPSRATVYRRLRELEHFAVDKDRFGLHEAAKRNRGSVGGVVATRPLERVEIDHTQLDVCLIDDGSGASLGRPTLTLAVDVFTRMIVGFYLSFSAPSASSVLECLRVAVLPKSRLLAQHPDIRGDWPVQGVPYVIALDNAMEMHSARLREAAQALQIGILFCPSRRPWFKPYVERLNRTIAETLVHTLPGTTFSNPTQRRSYASQKEAVLGLKAMQKILLKWVVEIYSVKTHRGINMPPIERWNQHAQPEHLLLPGTPAELDVLLALRATKPVHHYGIELDGIRYNSPALQVLRRSLKPYSDQRTETVKLDCRYYEHAAGYIDVLDPQLDQFIRVPATGRDAETPLDRHTHRAVTKHLTQKYGRDYGASDMSRATAEIHGIVDTETDKLKALRRQLRRAKSTKPNANEAPGGATRAPRTAFRMPDVGNGIPDLPVSRTNDKNLHP